jgi:hypothetical protein
VVVVAVVLDKQHQELSGHMEEVVKMENFTPEVVVEEEMDGEHLRKHHQQEMVEKVVQESL